MKNKFYKEMIIIFIIQIVVIGIYYYISANGLFVFVKEVYLETGANILNQNIFFVRGKEHKYAQILSVLEDIDSTQPGDYIINYLYLNKEYNIDLHLIDSTAPIVEAVDHYAYIDYEFNVNDFIKSISEVGEYTIDVLRSPQEINAGNYKIEFKVLDQSGNSTIVKSNLYITMLKPKYNLELGSTLKAEDIVSDNKYLDYLDISQIDLINESGVGNYTVKLNYEGSEFECEVIKEDTVGPVIVTNDISLYYGEKITVNKLIQSITDESNFTYEIDKEIDFNHMGNQIITITAVDEFNNKTTKEINISIGYDKIGPTINGLNDIIVNKNTNIDYLSGVTSIDKKDGECNVTVDYSGVDVTKYGVYYAVYTSVDNSNNKITKKRKITVNHDNSDVTALVNVVAQNAGSNPVEILMYVRNNYTYSHDWGGDDPLWYGLTNYKGNCYVHALIYQALLNKAGYTSQLIWVTDKTHYWNLVYMDGTWKHCDTTPTSIHKAVTCVDDNVRYKNLQGRNWDRTAWPEAL